MKSNEATIPIEALDGLSVKEGDTLTVMRKGQGSVTLVARIRERVRDTKGAGETWAERWRGKFYSPDADHSGDPRMEYLLKRGVE